MKENRKVFLSFFTVFPVKSVVKERFSFWNRRTIFLSLSLSLPISLFVCVSLSLSLSFFLSLFLSFSLCLCLSFSLSDLSFSLSLFLSLSLYFLSGRQKMSFSRDLTTSVLWMRQTAFLSMRWVKWSEVKWRVQTGEIGYDK